jgi:hypothetical protein
MFFDPEKRGRGKIPKARKTVYNKYAALFHKEQPKTFLSPDWDKLTYDQRQDISTIAKSNDYKFRVNYSRRKRFNPTKEKKLMDVFELTEQNFLDHGKYGVKKTLANGKTNPEYTKIYNYTQNDFKFPKKDLLPVKMQRQIMNTFDLPEGVTEWKFDEYKYGVPDTRGKNMNLGKRIANSLREIKSWKISTDWSKANGWMMHSMYRAHQNDMRLPNGKLAYEPKYEMIDGERKIIGFTDNTPAGGGKTYYGLKKWNKKYKGTDWANHGDFKKTSKFVDITKKAYAQPNEVIKGLLEKGGIPRNGKLQLNHVLKFLAQQEGYDIKRLKNAIVKHHMGGVGAGKVIGNPTNDLQILKVTTNNAIREIENKIRQGIYLKDDITTLKNYGASVRGPDGKLYGGGSRTAIGGFKAIEKEAETSIRNWKKKDFTEFNKYLQSFCGYGKSTGGRIGFKTGSCSPEVAKRNFLQATDDVAKGRVTGEAAEQIAKNTAKVVAKAGSKSALASLLGPYGIGIDMVYEVGSMGTDMLMNNVSLKEAMQNNWLTGAFIEGTGQEEYHKGLFAKDSSAKPYGTAKDLIDKIQSEEKNLERIKTNLVRGDYTGEAKKEIIAKQEEVIKNLYNDFDKVARKKATSPGHPEGEQVRYLALEEGSPEQIAYDQAKQEYDSGREAKAAIKRTSKAGFEESLKSSRAEPWIDFGLLKSPQYGKYSKRDLDQRLKQFGDYAGYGWTPYGLGYGMQQMKPGIGDKKYNKDLGYRQVAEMIADSEARDRIAEAGGVSKMADGGIMSLKKKKW